MSYDVFVQRFDGSDDPPPMDSSVFHAVFGPYVSGREPEFDHWRIREPQGGEAEIYADVSGATFGSLMITRFSSGLVLDLLADLARQAEAVILAPGCPFMMAGETQRADLPEEFRAEAIVIHGGSDIEAVLNEN